MPELVDLNDLPAGTTVVEFSEAALNVLPPELVVKCMKSGTSIGKAGLFPDDALAHMEQTLRKHKDESIRFAEMLKEIKAEDPPKQVKEKEVEATADVQSEQSFRMPFINKALAGSQSKGSFGALIEDTWSRQTFLSSQRPVNGKDMVQSKPKDKANPENNDASHVSTSQVQIKSGPPPKVSRLSTLILQLSRGQIHDEHPELITLTKKFAAKCIEGSPEWIQEIIKTEAVRQTKILTIMDIMSFCVANNNMEEWERLHRHLKISFMWGKTRNDLMRKYGAPPEELNMKIREAFVGVAEDDIKDKYPGIRTLPFFGESAADDALEDMVELGHNTKPPFVVPDAQPATRSTCKDPEVAEDTQGGSDVGTALTDMQRRVRRAVKAIRKLDGAESRPAAGKADTNRLKLITAHPAVKYVAGTPEHLQAVKEELQRAATEPPLLNPAEFNLVLKQASTWGLSPATLRSAEIAYQASLSGMMDKVIERLTPSEQAEMVRFGNGDRGALNDSTLEKVRVITRDTALKETNALQAATKVEPPTPFPDTTSQPAHRTASPPQADIYKKLLRSYFSSGPFREQNFVEPYPGISLPKARWDPELLDWKFRDTLRFLKLTEHVNHAIWERDMDADRRTAAAKNRLTSAGVPGRW